MSKEVIDEQIMALSGVNKALTNSIQSIEELKTSYQRAMQNAFDQGVDKTILEKYYNQYLSINLQDLKRLSDRMQSQDIPYITKIINHLIETPRR